jgi:prepilin-type N-terminal cleavage/methylation domain-containing protein
MRIGLKDQKGFSLMEIMIAVGLLGIVALGLTSLLSEMAKQQTGANIKSLLQSQKLKIEALVKDSKSWSNSIGHSTNNGKTEYTCLRNPPSGTCTGTVNTGTNYLNTISLVDTTGGTPWFNSSGAANGFTKNGTACTAWPSLACPIRWDITVTHTCQTVSPCLTPTTKVTAVPNIPAAIQAQLNVSINPDNYKVDVTRGLGTRFDPILVTENLSSNGAGRCSSGAPPYTQNRQMNTEVQDPASNVSVSGNQITFVPGSYQCRITAPAFKVGNHFITFETSGGTVIGTSAAASSPQYFSVPSNAVLEVAFVVSANTAYVVKHHCQFNTMPAPPPGGGAATDNNLQLGFSTATAGAYGSTFVTYATVSCYRNG